MTTTCRTYLGSLLIILSGTVWTNAFAQIPILSFYESNRVSVATSGFLPRPRYLPYDPPTSTAPRDVASSRLSGLVSVQLYPLREVALPGTVVFGVVESFLIDGHERSASHVENIQYGVGYLWRSGMFCRITHSRYVFHDALNDSGALIWSGVSVGLSHYQLPITGSLKYTITPEFYLYPPHNEFDPNPGAAFSDRVTARYSFDMQIEITSEQLPRASLVGRLFLPMGDSRPQHDNNWKADIICVAWQLEARYRITKNLFGALGYSAEEDTGGLAEGDRRRDFGYIRIEHVF